MEEQQVAVTSGVKGAMAFQDRGEGNLNRKQRSVKWNTRKGKMFWIASGKTVKLRFSS